MWGVSLLALIIFIPTEVQAGCTVMALCDMPPGQCGTGHVCNGGQPCQINDGGWYQQTKKNCYCSLGGGECSIEGSLCGGSSNNPYGNGESFGYCNQCDETTETIHTCREVTWDGCCTPGGNEGGSNNDDDGTGNGSNANNGNGGDGESGNNGSGSGGESGSNTDGGNNNDTTNGTCDYNGSCNALSENCETCPDCLCEVGAEAWWQTVNGSVYAQSQSGSGIMSPIFKGLCVLPVCIPLLNAPNQTLNPLSEGIAFTGGSDIDTNGFTNTNQVEAIGTSVTRIHENYAFFYRRSRLGLFPENVFSGQANDAQKPTGDDVAYFHDGDVVIQSPWQIEADESYVIFIDGNLTIHDTGKVNQLITVESGGFLAFILTGNITISEDVGNEDLSDTTSNIEGVYIADGIITVESRGESNGGDDRFVGAGTFVGWDGVELNRNFSDGGERKQENADKPVETFIYRPDFVLNTPAIMKSPHRIWQEVN